MNSSVKYRILHPAIDTVQCPLLRRILCTLSFVGMIIHLNLDQGASIHPPMHGLALQLSNRYNSTGVTTDAIFQIDDDRKIPCEYVEEAFLLWQFLGDLSFVLPFYDAARWLNFMVRVAAHPAHPL